MSESHMGKKHPMWGKHHKPESILKMIKAKLGKKHTQAEKDKISKALKGKMPKNLSLLHMLNIGKAHGMWKGDKVKYASLHNWVQLWKGIPEKCSECGIKGKKIGRNWSIQWANINHLYRRNLNDYIALCQNCHYGYDLKNNNFRKSPEFSTNPKRPILK